MIKGTLVELVPATLDNKQRVYEWCFLSETTKSHSGPPDYPENPISTPEEFFAEDGGYEDYFFTGEHPEKGRAFIITNEGKQVGCVTYCSFHMKPGMSELDIWMNSEANCGKGFGSDAIIALCKYLNEQLGVYTFIMRPSVRNARAIAAYMKAGFHMTDKTPADFLRDEYVQVFGAGDYGVGGDVLLIKSISPANAVQ